MIRQATFQLKSLSKSMLSIQSSLDLQLMQRIMPIVCD